MTLLHVVVAVHEAWADRSVSILWSGAGATLSGLCLDDAGGV